MTGAAKPAGLALRSAWWHRRLPRQPHTAGIKLTSTNLLGQSCFSREDNSLPLGEKLREGMPPSNKLWPSLCRNDRVIKLNEDKVTKGQAKKYRPVNSVAPYPLAITYWYALEYSSRYRATWQYT